MHVHESMLLCCVYVLCVRNANGPCPGPAELSEVPLIAPRQPSHVRAVRGLSICSRCSHCCVASLTGPEMALKHTTPMLPCATMRLVSHPSSKEPALTHAGSLRAQPQKERHGLVMICAYNMTPFLLLEEVSPARAAHRDEVASSLQKARISKLMKATYRNGQCPPFTQIGMRVEPLADVFELRCVANRADWCKVSPAVSHTARERHTTGREQRARCRAESREGCAYGVARAFGRASSI